MTLPIYLVKDSRDPMYHQVENRLKALIVSGQLAVGARLPSIRVLSKDLEISVITTRKAYHNLEVDGFIHTIQGKGTFVKEVDGVLKAETTEKAVLNAFENAIQIAVNYDFTTEEIEDVFKTVLRSHKGGK